MARLGTRKLKIEIDGTPYTAQVSKAVFGSAEGDSDFVTFEDASKGGKRDYALSITAEQNLENNSLWRKVWDKAGTDVPVTVIPYGNLAPSVLEPHVKATCTISEPDGDFLGGEANASSTAAFTIEVSWACTEKPKLITA